MRFMKSSPKVLAFVPLIILREAFAAWSRRLKRLLFYARFAGQPLLADRTIKPALRARMVVAVVHVTSIDEHRDRELGHVKTERLATTLDGLLMSFAHCSLDVLIITMRERHVFKFLPDYLQSAVSVVEVECDDPMFIGFQAQDRLIARRDLNDWFMFIEDDIEIRDGDFLDKVSRFCEMPGMERCVLQPNRFEYWQGVKRYIDLTPFVGIVTWNRLSTVVQDGNRLSECSNPHSGVFCLSRAQLDMFVATGRNWRGADIMGGPRESSATFSLMECFTLYKPHPENFSYLEVRHVDTKYSQLHPDVSEYSCAAFTLRTPGAT